MLSTRSLLPLVYASRSVARRWAMARFPSAHRCASRAKVVAELDVVQMRLAPFDDDVQVVVGAAR